MADEPGGAAPAVEFRGVRFAYGRRPVLEDLDLAVGRGEIVALVGRSGSGKSTTLKLANRLLLPDRGAVVVDGRDTRDWDPIRLRRRTGYVLQEIGLFPHLSVGENVALVPRLEGWTPARRQARARELLDLVGLPPAEFAARWPRELSGGQRQRVGVARALAAGPALLLMDEPFGALDPLTRRELHAVVRHIHAELGPAMLVVTHDIAEAFALAARVGVLDDRGLVACDTPAAIRASADPRVRGLLEAARP